MSGKVSENYYVKINDSFVVSSVRDYAKENKVDSLKSLIGINIKTDTYRTMVYVNHSIRDLNKYSRLPSYYTTIENYIVLIFTDADKFFKKSLIKAELEAVIERKNISLNKTEMIEESLGWKFTKCEDGVTKQLETEEIELPCFLRLAVVGGKVQVVEQELFKD
jgi:hypothetical protein